MREARTESRESKSTQASANFDLVAIAEQLSRAMPADAAVDDPVLAEIRHELGITSISSIIGQIMCRSWGEAKKPKPSSTL